jgi:hypothetical protein
MSTNTATELVEDRGDDLGTTATETPVEETKVVAPVEDTAVEETVVEEEAEDEGAKPVLIPKNRYDFKASQAKQAQKRAEEAEAKLKAYEERDKASKPEELVGKISELDVQIENARKDGNADLVVTLTKQQREMEREYYTSSVQPIDKAEVVAAAIEANQLNEMITRLETTYDFLDPENEQYDQALIDEIEDIREALELRGHNKVDALTRAASYVLNPLLEPEAKPAEPVAPVKGVSRKTDVRKNVADANRIPADLSSVALPSDAAGLKTEVPDIFKMSEREFAALDEKTLRQMRGDTI